VFGAGILVDRLLAPALFVVVVGDFVFRVEVWYKSISH
jgi:hypothetical protein